MYMENDARKKVLEGLMQNMDDRMGSRLPGYPKADPLDAVRKRIQGGAGNLTDKDANRMSGIMPTPGTPPKAPGTEMSDEELRKLLGG